MSDEKGGPRPLIMIVDSAVAMTGAVMAARREAAVLRDLARIELVLPADTLIADADLPEFERVHRLPLPTLRRSVPGLLAYGPGLLLSAFRLARLLRERGCTRLQVNDFTLAQASLSRMFGFSGRIATWVRMDPRREPLAFGTLLRLVYRASDELVAVSRFIQQCLPKGMQARLVHDPAPVRPTGDSASPPSSRLLFIGNYIEGKGQDAAIRAFQEVAADFPGAELVFHGGDMGLDKNRRYRAELERMAADGPACERIRFGDFVADSTASLKTALVAVNLSRSESFSLTCQEASACGVAVIATRCGGPEEIVEGGVTGWLVLVDDVAAAAAAMRQALADPERTRAMGQSGARLMAERFGVEPFRRALIDLFQLPKPRAER